MLTRQPSSDYDSDNGVPSAYGYDTGSEIDTSPKKSIKAKKTFKPSHKKKIQLTFEELTVRTIP